MLSSSKIKKSHSCYCDYLNKMYLEFALAWSYCRVSRKRLKFPFSLSAPHLFLVQFLPWGRLAKVRVNRSLLLEQPPWSPPGPAVERDEVEDGRNNSAKGRHLSDGKQTCHLFLQKGEWQLKILAKWLFKRDVLTITLFFCRFPFLEVVWPHGNCHMTRRFALWKHLPTHPISTLTSLTDTKERKWACEVGGMGWTKWRIALILFHSAQSQLHYCC